VDPGEGAVSIERKGDQVRLVPYPGIELAVLAHP
jgi:hypothetical protein